MIEAKRSGKPSPLEAGTGALWLNCAVQKVFLECFLEVGRPDLFTSLLILRDLIPSTGMSLLSLYPVLKASVRLAWRSGSNAGMNLRTTDPAVEETRRVEEPR